jgi:hypothetical protein
MAADARDTFRAGSQHRPDRDGDERGERVRLSASELVANDRLLDTLADRLADRLIERFSAPERQEGLVDAREIARLTGKTRRWVYEHARELGAVPLGTGSRPRLGFSPDVIAQLKAAPKEPIAPPVPLRTGVRRRQHATGASRTVEDLLNGPRVVVGARANGRGRSS